MKKQTLTDFLTDPKVVKTLEQLVKLLEDYKSKNKHIKKNKN